MLGFGRRTSGPCDFQARSSQNENLGVFDDTNGEQIRLAVTEFGQSLLFRAQGVVRFVERHAELVLPRDERANRAERFADRLGHGRERRTEDQLMVGEDGNGSVGGLSGDFDGHGYSGGTGGRIRLFR